MGEGEEEEENEEEEEFFAQTRNPKSETLNPKGTARDDLPWCSGLALCSSSWVCSWEVSHNKSVGLEKQLPLVDR